MHDQPRADRFEGPRVVLVSGSPALVDSVRRRRRAAHLASTERAGVHSRRLIRQRHHKILRDGWYVFAGISAAGTVVCLAVKLSVWEPVNAYLIGAIAASTLWACHSILTSVDGLAGKRGFTSSRIATKCPEFADPGHSLRTTR